MSEGSGASIREHCIDAVREVLLDIEREHQPADWDPDLGVDEPYTDAEYGAIADAVIREIAQLAAAAKRASS